LNFGTHEGLHFDNLPKAEKSRFSDPNFQANGGESWPDVRKRAQSYFKNLNSGTHLCFTHGGLITAYLYKQGLKEMP
jgi:broad specificity phosphatase PhoE